MFRLSVDNESVIIDRTSFDDNLNLDFYFIDVFDFSDDSNCYVFQEFLINMSNEFRKQITNDYINEKIWIKLLSMLNRLIERMKQKQNTSIIIENQFAVETSTLAAEENSTKEEERVFKKFRIDVNFELDNDFIYYVDEKVRRLYLFTAVEEEVFRLIHDENAHAGIHRCFNRIIDIFYIFKLNKKIRRYIEHCLDCQLTQIKRHRSYDELMSITSSSHSFHIIAMNFIVILSSELNSVLTVTCKFFRKIVLIIDKIIYSVSQWINALLNRLLIADWNISIVFIFDRDFKFMFEMWQIFFRRLDTKLLMSTAYHSQIDDIFERTNQTIEITIRFLITNYSNINFVLTLSSLQAQFNNFVNVAIDLSHNEINYDFKIRDALSNLSKQSKQFSENLATQRLEYRRKATNVIVFVNVKTKIHYDARHTSLLLKTDDYVYFRLHQDYQLSNRLNKKTSQQRCDFFLVKRRVERLAYELNLFSVWRLHSMISIAQLKLVSFDENFYRRSRSSHFDVVEWRVIHHSINSTKSKRSSANAFENTIVRTSLSILFAD